MKIPHVGDIAARVSGSLPNIRKYDGNQNNKKNNMTGWISDIKDDSWEAEEEKRLDEERIKLARAENERKAEEVRQAELRRQQEEVRLAQIRAEEARKQRKVTKEQELVKAKQECKDATAAWNKWSNSTGKYMSHSA